MRLIPRRRRTDQTGVPTMRLYTLTGTTQVKDPVTGTVYEAGADGAFNDLPEDLGIYLHSFHANGKPAWEDDAERARRVQSEQLDKMRDPATLLAELQKMSANQGALASILAGALSAAPQADTTPAPAAVASETPSVEAEAPVAKKTARTRKPTASQPAATE